MRSATELLALIDAAAAPLAERHAAEVADVDAQIRAHGERGSGRKQLDERHKRELRRHRTDEMRAGLAAMAATYRDALASGTGADVEGCARAVHRIHAAIEALDRNPNDKLLMESLLWSLPDARGT
jgi:DNA polymerase-3 subunit delta'